MFIATLLIATHIFSSDDLSQLMIENSSLKEAHTQILAQVGPSASSGRIGFDADRSFGEEEEQKPTAQSLRKANEILAEKIKNLEAMRKQGTSQGKSSSRSRFDTSW